GVDLPEEFMATIGNHLASGTHIVHGASFYADRLRQMANAPAFTFRTYTEALGKVADRKHIPEEIRTLLGEVLDPGPRIASEALEAGGVASARNLFATIAGAKRVSVDDIQSFERAALA